MRVKTTYGLIGLMLGIVMAFLVGAGFFALTIVALWMFVYGNNSWPQWLNDNLFFLFFIPFITATALISWAALKRGAELEEKEDEVIIKKAKRNFKIAFIIFLVFILSVSFLVLRKYQVYKKRILNTKLINDLGLKLTQIDSIELGQDEAQILVKVNLKNQLSGKYQLFLDFKSISFAQCPLLQLTQVILEGNKDEQIILKAPFERITEVYREHLPRYLMSEDVLNVEPFGVDEIIAVEARLVFLGNEQYKKLPLGDLEYQKEPVSALGMFYFSCFKDKCEIVQTDNSSEEMSQEEVPSK